MLLLPRLVARSSLSPLLRRRIAMAGSPAPSAVPAAAAASTSAAAAAMPPRSGSSSPVHKRARHDDGADRPAAAVQSGPAAAAAPSGSAAAAAAPRVEPAKALAARKRARAAQMAKFGVPPIEHDVRRLLGADVVARLEAEERDWELRASGEVCDVRIETLGSGGDGLAKAPGGDWAIVVPHVLPGELVRVRWWSNERMWSKADLLEVLEPSEQRLPAPCQYFGQCGGCQYQMLSYSEQLAHKQLVVERAFANYSGLPAELLPRIGATLPSPQQLRYRTKLTPHFDLPRRLQRGKGGRPPKGGMPDTAEVEQLARELPIGFEQVKGKGILDIEECIIATPTINEALPGIRQGVRDRLASYKNGATLLLRDSFVKEAPVDGETATEVVLDEAAAPAAPREERSEVVTDHKAVVRERVGKIMFESPAGAFFQNNRSILPSLLGYVEAALQALPAFAAEPKERRFLVDTYCGSGFFALSLAHLFERVAGVEISAESVVCATRNAALNQITNCEFLAGSSEAIFAKIKFAAAQTTLIIDPPRRGCDDAFLTQLLRLRPRLVVYVSCNVHTQARDIGHILRGEPRYEVVSACGADLFPMTYHVEGVAVLQLRDEAPVQAPDSSATAA